MKLNKIRVILVCALVLSTPSVIAAASPTNITDTFQIPGSSVMQRTVYNTAEFDNLSKSKAKYQAINNGKLITFGPQLGYLSSQDIPQEGAAWAYGKNGDVIGMTGCLGRAIGIDEGRYISDLTTGNVIMTAQSDNLVDAHELLIDKQGSYWYLSYPEIDCSVKTALCASYNVDKTSIFSDCQINAVSASGSPLYTWRASEHIQPAMIVNSYRKEWSRGDYVDLFHCNSIDLVNSSSVLLSSRNTNSIYLIDTTTSKIVWKLGGHFQRGTSLLTSGFNRRVGSESIAQHDARSLGNGLFSYYDNASHTSDPARGVIFKVSQSGKSVKAVMVKEFANPEHINSLCQGSMRVSDLGNVVIGWGCALGAVTIFNSSGNPIVSLAKIKTPETAQFFSDVPFVLNGVDFGPAYNYLLSYRVVPILTL